MENTIYIGSLTDPSYVLHNADVRGITAVLSTALVGDELAVDQCVAEVVSRAYIIIHVPFIPENSSGLITADGALFCCGKPIPELLPHIEYGTPIWWYSGDNFMGKFYAQSLTRQSRTDLLLTTVSRIGLLDKQQHMGGMYTGQTFAEVAADILGDGIPFTVSADLKDQSIYNWLPVATRRENLHQLLYAMGAVISKDAAGELVFKFLDPSSVMIVPDDRIYADGEVTVTTPANRVELSEHSYFALDSDQEVTLFDNSDGTTGLAEDELVLFSDAPVHSLSVTGSLTVSWSNCNAARVSGIGILTGKRYTHVTRMVTRQQSGGEPNTISVDGATLISVANSENAADRLFDYYTKSRTISSDLVVQGERPGMRVRITDPFYDPVHAFIASMDLTSGGILRAAADLIVDYTPTKGGNNFSASVLLTGRGSWTVPEGVTQIRVVLIGGGSGGRGGFNAADLSAPDPITYTDLDTSVALYQKGFGPSILPGGPGGDPGQGGAGGRILVVTISVTPGQSIDYSCGVGGEGGQPGLAPTDGAEGSDTTFGGYTSADGQRSTTGYIDQLSGRVLALPGDAGYAGAAGGGYVNDGNDNYIKAYPTLTAEGSIWNCGQSYLDDEVEDDRGSYDTSPGYFAARVTGSFGGGPAYGSDGKPGSTPGTSQIDISSTSCWVKATNGGAGADALPLGDADVVGAGGRGGNGGGGPGSFGICVASNRIKKTLSGGGLSTLQVSKSGLTVLGGAGSRGSKGGPGGVLIYY